MLENGKVYTFKLNSGEEFIAKVVDVFTEENTIHINEPVSIAPSQGGMQMIPSMFTADPSFPVTLNTSCVTMYSETEDSIKMKYIEATTGIKIPEKKILVG
jgi:hypothetical protein